VLLSIAGFCRVLQLCRRVLQCVAVCCSVLQCVAVCCSVLQCVAVCCSVLQCVAVCLPPAKHHTPPTSPMMCWCVQVIILGVLHSVTGCYRVVQGVAVCCRVLQFRCSVLQCVAMWLPPVDLHTPATAPPLCRCANVEILSVLRGVAGCCRVSQGVAGCCRVL